MNPEPSFNSITVSRPAGVAHAEPGLTTIRAIQDAVCAHYGVTRALLLSNKRARCIARLRQVAMWLARTCTKHSTSEIGRWFGGRDHTTIMHGTAVISRLVEIDPAIAGDVAALRAGVGA